MLCKLCRLAARASLFIVTLSTLLTDDALAFTDLPMRLSRGQFESANDQRAFEKSVSNALSGTVRLVNPADDPVNGDGEGGDYFGSSVAISGETALVGAKQNRHALSSALGSAYVFVRSGGQWALQATLVAPDGEFNDQFGSAVALSGDTAVISAPGTPQGGAAYVFVRSAQTWNMQAKLVGADTAWAHRFGWDVAVDGDLVVVGAPERNAGNLFFTGTAYVFARNGTQWAQQDQLFAPTAVEFSHFGHSVAISGGSLIVGAPNGGGVGSAHVFVQMGADWIWQSTLPAPGGEADDKFGSSVAISGNTAAVGARLDDTDTFADIGSVSTYVRSGSTWTWQAKLTPGDGSNFHEFGHDIALSGNTLVAGSHYFSSPSQSTKRGAAYIYVSGGSTWTLQGRVQPADVDGGDEFGTSVAISGESLLAGAPFDDTIAGNSAGTAGVFVRNSGVWTQQAQLSAGNGAAEHRFGLSVSLSGTTALVGAPSADAPTAVNAGAVYVFVRNGSAWTQQARLTAADAEEDAKFGSSIALTADTAIIGSPLKDGSIPNSFQPDVGAVYVYVRNGSVWTQQAKLTASDNQTGDEFGNAVAINGDTILVGAWREGSAISNKEGSAYVFTRSGAAWVQQAKLVAPDAALNDSLGSAVALSSDTALVSAKNGGSPTNPGVGSVYVFARSGTAWTFQAELTAEDVMEGGFGRSVSVSGNTAMVGFPSADNSMADASGAVYVYVRSGVNWGAPSRLVPNVPVSGENFGYSVSVVGDLAIIGAPGYTFNPSGAAYLFARQGSIWSQDSRITGASSADAFGAAVSISEGMLLIGSPNFSESISQNPNVGAAYLARLALFADGFED